MKNVDIDLSYDKNLVDVYYGVTKDEVGGQSAPPPPSDPVLTNCGPKPVPRNGIPTQSDRLALQRWEQCKLLFQPITPASKTDCGEKPTNGKDIIEWEQCIAKKNAGNTASQYTPPPPPTMEEIVKANNDEIAAGRSIGTGAVRNTPPIATSPTRQVGTRSIASSEPLPNPLIDPYSAPSQNPYTPQYNPYSSPSQYDSPMGDGGYPTQEPIGSLGLSNGKIFGIEKTQALIMGGLALVALYFIVRKNNAPVN